MVLESVVGESGERPRYGGWLRLLVLPRERSQKGLWNKKRAREVLEPRGK